MENQEGLQQLASFSLHEALQSLRAFIDNDHNIELIAKAGSIIAGAISRGNKVLSCGNGGSLCDATHFAEELTGRFRGNRNALPAIALNDPAHITCVGNDYSFAEIFSRYVMAVGKEGDVLVVISTSGGSANILNAVRAAHDKKMLVIGLTSDSDNTLRREADVAICAPRTPYSDRIQEIHIKVLHIIVQVVERQLFGNYASQTCA